jgi:hypothetical protein
VTKEIDENTPVRELPRILLGVVQARTEMMP